MFPSEAGAGPVGQGQSRKKNPQEKKQTLQGGQVRAAHTRKLHAHQTHASEISWSRLSKQNHQAKAHPGNRDGRHCEEGPVRRSHSHCAESNGPKDKAPSSPASLTTPCCTFQVVVHVTVPASPTVSLVQLLQFPSRLRALSCSLGKHWGPRH